MVISVRPAMAEISVAKAKAEFAALVSRAETGEHIDA
jgi:antitoxin (DNA-binding transcriptional repressor) of toxin-antitoxin stability system